MRLMSRLDDERKSGAIWYAIFRQSPKLIRCIVTEATASIEEVFARIRVSPLWGRG
jgi:hypothetical protein